MFSQIFFLDSGDVSQAEEDKEIIQRDADSDVTPALGRQLHG